MRKTVYILVVFLAVAAVSLPGCKKPTAGWGSLSGHVTSSVSGEPMEGVSVLYGDSAVLTDAAGAYFYKNLPDGLQGFRYRMDGYYPVMKQVNITAGGEAVCDVVMDIITAGWAAGTGDSGYGTILYSPDAGQSWVRQGSPSMIPDVRLKDVFAVNDQICWIAGEADTLRGTTVILYTKDGGATWSNQGSSLRTSRPVSIAAIVAYDKDTAWAVTSDTCMVIKTVNGGGSWSVCRESSSVVSYSALTVADGRNVWCCGQAADGNAVVEYSPDGGTTWSEMPVSAASSSQRPTDIYAASGPVLYLSGAGAMGILRSADGGETWENALSADVDINSMEVCFDNYVWAAGSGGIMYVSTDGLLTDDEVNPADGGYSTGTLSSVSFLRDAARGACSVMSSTGESGTIYYTVDGGRSWSQSSVPYEFGVESVDFVGGSN